MSHAVTPDGQAFKPGPVETDNRVSSPGLVDRFGRVHRSLRISVTDACNIRCQYCMPAEGAEFLPHSRLLSFTQIETLVRAFVPLGIRHLRLTGGEPLLRPDLHQLIARLSNVSGVDDLAMTTNGMLLARTLPDLVAAGLQRVNISLDTLSADTFKRLSRRDGFEKVLEGIEAAVQHPGLNVKLNALVLRDVNLHEVLDLVGFAAERDLHLRFIEFMPLDAEKAWSNQRVVQGQELRPLITSRFGQLVEMPSRDLSRPARDYAFSSGLAGRVGFIDSVSSPFCSKCDRLRITADGKIRNCLFGQEEWDLAELLESPDSVQRIHGRLQECVLAKHAAHGIADPDFRPPKRAMYQIGG